MERKEEKEQARLIRWAASPPARHILPQLTGLFHVPNGGKRDAMTGAQMVALGVKRGVPDLLLPWPSNGWHGLAIEMKAPGGVVSPHQKEWIDRLTSWGWLVQLAYSADQARQIIADYADKPALLELPL